MPPHDTIRAVEWKDNHLILLDQRKLPHAEHYLQLYSAEDTAEAIRNMVVRGAPAIGIAAAYGLLMAARKAFKQYPHDWRARLQPDIEVLAAARPTAVNLHWALQRMLKALDEHDADPIHTLMAVAQQIHQADIEANHRMALLGSELIKPTHGVLTHCNTGSLATGGYGTALGVIRAAYGEGKIEQVYADETRPWWQGSRLTAWELMRDKIPTQLICEGAAAHLMKLGKISWVIVGADRVAANGDVANKIGTYSLAVLARFHGVRFMVVAPTSTIDLETVSGEQIPLEERSADEILNVNQQRIAAPQVGAWNPAFDVTPGKLVDILVTEKGIVLRPDTEKLSTLMQS
ncbi:methylthioribose-1-phosphate isomerase [Thiothrix eikelboomii]|uniref:Methylthioribose-1-phosphate isomerase n=1 Tax=Thiothrix eikelboomii TaxID=92487 RepID=A0A1T4W5T5_9GAMM|nr:S-methyl-5-thioribose-1-phosphate isomerase [Thiothrix eikelboomii]SKA72071.1 methylthioribose-1-phosphate isomerase [Thiothrix eikelboomii]